MASFELDRRSVAGCAVTPLGVIEHLDVVEDVDTRLTARGVDLPTHAFALEQLEATPATALSWHWPRRLMLLTRLWSRRNLCHLCPVN